MSRLTALAALPVCLALAACGSGGGDRPPPPKPDPVSAPLAGVGDMCSYAERKKPIVVGHKFWTGRAYYGDLKGGDLKELRAKWFLGGSGGRVATAVARPKLEVHRTKIDSNCYDEAKKVYYGCTKTIETPMGDIRVLARAVRQEEADRLAIQMCKREVRERLEKKTEVALDTWDIACSIVARRKCPLPPPPPPPAPKKTDQKKDSSKDAKKGN